MCVVILKTADWEEEIMKNKWYYVQELSPSQWAIKSSQY